MQPIEHIYIVAQKSDFWLARICLGSVRYWYPEIEVTLLVDPSQGWDPSEAIEEVGTLWHAHSIVAEPAWMRYWTKLRALWNRPGERFLLLDADTVLLGPVLETLSAFPEDFIVEWPYGSLMEGAKFEAEARAAYLTVSRVKEKFPDYVPPGFFFNSGQIVGRGGILQPEDFEPCIDRRGSFPVNRYPELFRYNDQGMFNFVVAEMVRKGLGTVRPFNFMKWGYYGQLTKSYVKKVRRREGAPPFILHWAGAKLPFKSCLPHNDLLHFYEAFYYGRMKGGARERWKDLWKRIGGFTPTHGHGLMKQVDGGRWLRTRIMAAELRPRVRSHFPRLAEIARGE
jgi:hypothetical protein